jgi:hypothetical protein
MTPAPIVLFVYNRPWHTRQTFESLKKNKLAQESELFIYSDGPRNKQDAEKVNNVREYLSNINGFKKISIIERKKNFGLANSIIDGVTRVVNENGKVIVLEDDLITSSFFIRYMNEALEKYENNDVVMQISGHMFPVEINTNEDAFFLPFTTTWGWGTWKRAWNKLDLSSKYYEKLKSDRKLRYLFNLNGAYDYYQLLKDRYIGKNNSWGILWYVTVFFNKGIVLFPSQTLVNQIGFDGSGRHCGNVEIPQQKVSDKPISKLPEPLTVDNDVFNSFTNGFKIWQNRIKKSYRFSAIKRIFLD